MLPGSAAGSWPPRPVLVVEPESARRDTICRMVRGLGYRVRTARNGADAVRAVRQAGVDMGLVIARADMQPMDGGELAERVRDLRAEMPVVLLTSAGAQDDELLTAYPELPVLREPVRLGELYSLLAHHLGPPAVTRGRGEGPSRWLRRSRDRSESSE